MASRYITVLCMKQFSLSTFPMSDGKLNIYLIFLHIKISKKWKFAYHNFLKSLFFKELDGLLFIYTSIVFRFGQSVA